MQESQLSSAKQLVRIGKQLRILSFGYLSLVALPSYFCLDLLCYGLTPMSSWWCCQKLWENFLQTRSEHPINDFVHPIACGLILSLCLPAPMTLTLLWSIMTTLFMIAEVLQQEKMLAYGSFCHK